MILVDTNVLSELVRPTPHPAVLRWVGSHPATSLYTTTITQAELLLGAALLPADHRRAALTEALTAILEVDLAGRVLAFDSDAARAYAQIFAARRAAGRPIAQFDAQIAAIGVSRGAAVATRNTADLSGCGCEVVDPWG